MLEVEAKYRAADWDAVRSVLRAWGAAADPARTDEDHYFNAPDRDFAQTGEAFRLRRIGDDNRFTYKGPRRETATKTRPEIELPVAPGREAAATAARLLTSLGYRPVAVVTKSREVFHLSRGGFAVEVCLDDAGPLGRFVEVEIQADEADFEAAKAVLLATAADLGLTEQEPRSYLRMLLESRGAG